MDCTVLHATEDITGELEYFCRLADIRMVNEAM
jgi:hypothetical protein